MDKIDAAVSSVIEEHFKRFEPPADAVGRVCELVDNWPESASPERLEESEIY